MHSPKVPDTLGLLSTAAPTFVSSPDPAPPLLSALPSGSEDGQGGCSWGERVHSGSPESPQIAARSPPPPGTLPVVCRHGDGGIRSGNTGTNRAWLTTGQSEGRLLSLASKELPLP